MKSQTVTAFWNGFTGDLAGCYCLQTVSYHKSKKVKEFLEKYNDKIVLEYLLPYTPELNPIEMQWRVIKRVLSAKVFGTLDEMEQSVRVLFARKEILPVKMFSYLMC